MSWHFDQNKEKFEQLKKLQFSMSILRRSVVQSIPTFCVVLYFTRSIGFALIANAILVIVNFLHMKKFTHPFTVNSRFFPGTLTSMQYYYMSTFYVLGAVAKAKGKVTKNDIQYAVELMREFHVDSDVRDSLVKIFNQGRVHNIDDVDKVIAEFCSVFRGRGRVCEYFFSYQLNAAMQDGELHVHELAILRTIANYMGMSEAVFNLTLKSVRASCRFRQEFYTHYQNGWGRYRDYSYQDSYQGTHRSYDESQGSGGRYENRTRHLQNAYDILGVQENDDFAAVKKTYRRLIKQYHPDKYVAQDVPDVVVEKANKKSQEIIGAYEFICKTKGWK